jgi:AraC-like DNA-binding protein
MAQCAKRYMDRHRIVRTHDMDAATAFLQTKGYYIDVARRDATQLDMCINCAVLPGLSVGYLQNGIPAVMRSLSELVEYQIILPLHEPMEVSVSGQRVDCGPERAVVSSPQQDYRASASGIGARLRICMTERAVREHLSTLLGEVPIEPLQFAPAMELTSGFGKSFARHVLAATEDFELTNSISASQATITSFEQFIIGELLLYHPHNYSGALDRVERSISPRDVKRAIDYIHAHFDEPLTISSIATTAGVAGRTLFKHFRDAHGISPMGFVRDLRFEKARQELLNGRGEKSVTEIATRCGFNHFGRFAVEYRLRFGESPSQTLGKRSAGRARSLDSRD